jgi:two-component system, chemotaxis family, chemotaxis protein CheY
MTARKLVKAYLSPFRVAIADPNPFMRRVIRQVLASCGAELITEYDSVISVYYLDPSHAPDIIISELFFHDGSLEEFLRSTRANVGAVRFVPVIMVTAFTTKEWITRIRDAGVDEIIAKPFTASTVLSRIREVIEVRRPFVDTGRYFGPDRRRRVNSTSLSSDRRALTLSPTMTGELTQDHINAMVSGG